MNKGMNNLTERSLKTKRTLVLLNISEPNKRQPAQHQSLTELQLYYTSSALKISL